MFKKIILWLLTFSLIACRGKSEAPANTGTPTAAKTPAATRTFAPPVFIRSPTPTRKTEGTLFNPATPIVSSTPVPPTLSPTPILIIPTQIFHQRGYDMPIGNYYQFIIHKAKDGERLEAFAEKYNTTVEAILAINYHLTNPVWEDMLFVVPIGFSQVAGLPVFVVYEIKPEERGISMDTLAKKLRVDVFDLKYYNGMTDPGQRPLVGDLILVPWWPDPNRKIIFDEPNWWEGPRQNEGK